MGTTPRALQRRRRRVIDVPDHWTDKQAQRQRRQGLAEEQPKRQTTSATLAERLLQRQAEMADGTDPEAA